MPWTVPNQWGLSWGGAHAQTMNRLIYITCCKCISTKMLQPWCFKGICFWVDFSNLEKVAPSIWRRVKYYFIMQVFKKEKKNGQESPLGKLTGESKQRKNLLLQIALVFASVCPQQVVATSVRVWTSASSFTLEKWVQNISEWQDAHSHPLHRAEHLERYLRLPELAVLEKHFCNRSLKVIIVSL